MLTAFDETERLGATPKHEPTIVFHAPKPHLGVGIRQNDLV